MNNVNMGLGHAWSENEIISYGDYNAFSRSAITVYFFSVSNNVVRTAGITMTRSKTL
jgi:hypothetical protein